MTTLLRLSQLSQTVDTHLPLFMAFKQYHLKQKLLIAKRSTSA